MKGNKERIGNSERIGKSDRIGNSDFDLKKIRGRRDFFDAVKLYIEQHEGIELHKLDAYFQYTTGASSTLIKQALGVLESLDLIKSVEPKTPLQDIKFYGVER